MSQDKKPNYLKRIKNRNPNDDNNKNQGSNNVDLDKNIENSLKLNQNDLINPLDNQIKSNLFFRLNVTGSIESGQVNILINLFYTITL
jgi:hypothetical protein